jgi:Tfp pilus assembly protein PilF
MFRLLRRTLFRPKGLLLLAAAVVCLGAAWASAAWYYRAEPHLTAGEKALDRHDFAIARAEFDAYLQAWPAHGRAHLLAAEAARRLGRYDDAEEHLRACDRLKWDPPAVALERTLADVQRGEMGEEAEQFLWERIDAGDAEALAVLEVLTQYYLDTYQLMRAKDCLNRYLELRPDDLQALLGRAYVWERLLYFADAAKDYRRAVELHPDDGLARLRLAKNLLITGEPAEALTHFERLAARRPEDREVRLGLAQCRRRVGDGEEAQRLLDGLLADRPDDAAALTERGLVALNQNRPDEAEGFLRKAVAAAPYNREANYNLYQSLLRQGKDDEAQERLAAVERLDADLTRLDAVSKAVIQSPGDAALRLEGGELFLRNGQEDEGVRWLELALRLDPTLRPAHRALADYFGRVGRADLAAVHSRLAAGAPP